MIKKIQILILFSILTSNVNAVTCTQEIVPNAFVLQFNISGQAGSYREFTGNYVPINTTPFPQSEINSLQNISLFHHDGQQSPPSLTVCGSNTSYCYMTISFNGQTESGANNTLLQAYDFQRKSNSCESVPPPTGSRTEQEQDYLIDELDRVQGIISDSLDTTRTHAFSNKWRLDDLEPIVAENTNQRNLNTQSIQDNTFAIESNTGQLLQHDVRITTNNNNVDALLADYGILTLNNDNQTIQIDDINNNLVQMRATDDNISTSLPQIINNTSATNTELTALNFKVGQSNTALDLINTNIGENNSVQSAMNLNIQDISSGISQLNTNTTAQNSTLGQINTKIGQNNSVQSAMNLNIQDISSGISQLNTNTTHQNSTLDQINTSINSNNHNLGIIKNNTAASAHNVEVIKTTLGNTNIMLDGITTNTGQAVSELQLLKSETTRLGDRNWETLDIGLNTNNDKLDVLHTDNLNILNQQSQTAINTGSILNQLSATRYNISGSPSTKSLAKINAFNELNTQRIVVNTQNSLNSLNQIDTEIGLGNATQNEIKTRIDDLNANSLEIKQLLEMGDLRQETTNLLIEDLKGINALIDAHQLSLTQESRSYTYSTDGTQSANKRGLGQISALNHLTNQKNENNTKASLVEVTAHTNILDQIRSLNSDNNIKSTVANTNLEQLAMNDEVTNDLLQQIIDKPPPVLSVPELEETVILDASDFSWTDKLQASQLEINAKKIELTNRFHEIRELASTMFGFNVSATTPTLPHLSYNIDTPLFSLNVDQNLNVIPYFLLIPLFILLTAYINALFIIFR